MLKYYSLKNEKICPEETLTSEVFWFCLEKPTPEEIEKVLALYPFPKDYISAVLDDTENSRYEKLNQENFSKSALVLLQYPFPKVSPSGYLQIETYPFSIILTPEGKIITVSNYEPPFVKKVLQEKFLTNISQWHLLFRFLWHLTGDFNQLLSVMKKSSDNLENKIQVATENKQLYQIMDIQKSLIYFEEATHDNQQVLQKFADCNLLGLTEIEKGQMHDILVENRQAVISARLQLKLVEKMNETFSSIVSNNLNNVMKILTSLTIVLTIPTIVGGVYGMNIQLPFANRENAFWWIFAGTFLLCGIVIYYLRKNRFL